MDRRAVLRLLGVGATGVSGCLGAESAEKRTATEATTGDPTAAEVAGETTAVETPVGESTASETATAEPTSTTGETTTTKIGSCPPSVISDTRRHVHDDYALSVVAENADEPAVAVVGEEWRSALRTDEMSDADRTFVSDTDFERFVVLVVQYTKSSGGHDLRVIDATVDGETLRADVCVVADGGTQDAPTANLFVRVPYSETPPANARVRIHRPRETVTVTSA